MFVLFFITIDSNSPADVSKFFIGPRFGFLCLFSTDFTSGGDMGLENGGCQDNTFEQFVFIRVLSGPLTRVPSWHPAFFKLI